jgi:hypothetical protein
MENLNQAFSNLVGVRQDSWEYYLRFIAPKQSLNPQVLIIEYQGLFLCVVYINAKEINFKQSYMNVYINYTNAYMEIK